MSSVPKIVVLTPVKNEAWILERFLSVTSQFADHIIIADQNSTDGSKEIYQRYPKVHVIENQDSSYNEASRQQLLIQTARELVKGPRILIALDSDEILAANAMGTDDWQRMLQATPGTVLYFEKPDLYLTPHRVIRYKNPWPLGYVDDGVEHNPRIIHSIRIPQPQDAQHLHLYNIKVLHYALTRPEAQKSKMRYYSVLENVNNSMRFYTRRKGYGQNRDFVKDGDLEKSDEHWFKRWEEQHIDMFLIEEQSHYWQDIEILRLFNKFGYKKFWVDDIWNIDYEKLRKYALKEGYSDIPVFKIYSPPLWVKVFLKVVDNFQRMYNAFKVTK